MKIVFNQDEIGQMLLLQTLKIFGIKDEVNIKANMILYPKVNSSQFDISVEILEIKKSRNIRKTKVIKDVDETK